MKNPSPHEIDWEALRSQIVGLNDRTLRKSYFPQLQSQIEELKKAREAEREKSERLACLLSELEASRAQTEASERKFRLLADYTNDMEYLIDEGGKIAYMSPSCERLTGYRPDEFEADSDLLRKIVHPDDLPLFEVHAHREVDSKPHSVDVRILTRHGAVRWFAHVCQFIVSPEGQFRGLRGSNRDITERKTADSKVLRLSNLYAALSRCNKAIVHSASEDSLFRKVCGIAVQRGGMKTAWVISFDASLRRCKCVASYGDDTGLLSLLELDLESMGPGDPMGIAIRSGQPAWSRTLQRDAIGAEFHAWAHRTGISSLAALPLFRKGEIVGCFALGTDTANVFDNRARRLLTEMAADMSFALTNFALEEERKRANEKIEDYLKRLESSYMDTLLLAMNLSEMRDPYTTGHEWRVGLIAKAIATEMGLEKESIKSVEVAGYLHDLGKIIIPSEILSRPGKLTPVEYMLIQGHVEAGYNVLRHIDFPWPIADIMVQHHERMDGSGYPKNLKGEEIIPLARILAVADVVEAMSSHRPYRPSKGIGAALDEIERGSGKLYDALVVDACLRLFREKDYFIPA
jgi:PAS domain S-box-containing protein/putative nucleotidyltransferase with HDIG domain